MKEEPNIAKLCIKLSNEAKVDLNTVLDKFYDFEHTLMQEQRPLLLNATSVVIRELFEKRIDLAYKQTEKYFTSEYERDKNET
jgi:hypothetical protein